MRKRNCTFRQARAGACEVGRNVALEALFGKRSAMAEQAKPLLAVGDDGAAFGGIARRSAERRRGSRHR